VLEKRLKGIELQSGGAQSTIRLTVERLNLLKEIIGECVIILSASSAVGSRRHTREARAALMREINKYNLAARDYCDETGFTVPTVSSELPYQVIRGESYVLPSYIRYVEEELIPEDDGIGLGRLSSRARRREEKRELLFAASNERRRSGYASLSEENGSEAIARARLAVGARYDSEIRDARDEIDFLKICYLPREADRASRRRELLSSLTRLEKNKRAAVMLEGEDNKRYRRALELCTGRELESLRLRLDTVLRERDAIDGKLINLYTGDGNGDPALMKRASAARRKRSASVARRFRRDMRILRERIPLDIKEKLTSLANGLIDREGRIAALKVGMKHKPRGSVARRDAAREIRTLERSLRPLHDDYRSMLKRAGKYAESIEAKRVQLAWLAGTALISIALGVLYFIFRDEINGFFTEHF